MAGFFSEVAHLHSLFLFPRSAFAGAGERYKTEEGQVPGMHPGNFCEELLFPSVGSVSLANWDVFHLLL